MRGIWTFDSQISKLVGKYELWVRKYHCPKKIEKEKLKKWETIEDDCEEEVEGQTKMF